MNLILAVSFLLLILCFDRINSAAVSLNDSNFEASDMIDNKKPNDKEAAVVFMPLEVEKDSQGDFFYDYNTDFDMSKVPLPPTEPEETINREVIFDFVQYFLQETTAFQNTIEVADSSTVTVQSKLSSHDHLWRKKEHVCVSKVAKKFRMSSKDFSYNYEHRCRTKSDSEMCITEIQAGSRMAKIASTHLCCPNFHLDSRLEECVASDDSTDLYDKLLANMEDIKFELTASYPGFEQTKFCEKFLELFEKLTNVKYDTNRSTKLTVYLWDSQAMVDYIHNEILVDKSEKGLEKLLGTLLNHIAEFHHPTQSIIQGSVSNVKTASNGHLRLSTFDVFDKSYEFVNCHKMVVKNQYFKPVPYDASYNYRLLIHQLENSSVLVKHEQTIYQILVNLTNQATFNQNNYDLNIFSLIFAKSDQKFSEQLNDIENQYTVFLPTDQAFAGMRADQLKSLIDDSTCADQFLSKFIISDEICTAQIFDHIADYSSSFQTASLITIVDKFGQKQTYFNGQNVSNKKVPFSGSNGMFYYLNTIKTSSFLDFLYDMVMFLKQASKIDYFNRLETDWESDLLNESFNTTFILPALVSSSPYQNLILANSTGLDESLIKINDYLFKGQLHVNELSDGQLLTSISGRKYLINTKVHSGTIPSFLKWVPARNFFVRSINCQKIEITDLKGCSSQIMFFNNKKLTVPELNDMSILEYFALDESISIFNSYLNKCGDTCRNIYRKMEEDTLSERTDRPSKGFTLLIPTNEFFKSYDYINDAKFVNSIKQSSFYGTWCEYVLLNNDVKIETLSGNFTTSSNIVPLIETYQKYLSDKSILVHTVTPLK